MILDNQHVKERYGKIASTYGVAHLAYKLLGMERRRRELVAMLALEEGDTVLDLGCGTGINFAPLQAAVGPSGRIIAIDLSGAMLTLARNRVNENGWSNVELREGDLATIELPSTASGAIATFALEMVPQYAAVLDRIAAIIREGQRIALMGAKEPASWPEWAIDAGVLALRRFGVSRDYTTFRPWVALGERTSIVRFNEFLGGAAYDCVGEVSSSMK